MNEYAEILFTSVSAEEDLTNESFLEGSVSYLCIFIETELNRTITKTKTTPMAVIFGTLREQKHCLFKRLAIKTAF